MKGLFKSALFNRINLERLGVEGQDGPVDSNALPVLLWQPALYVEGELRVSKIGSQADSMRDVSEQYAKWVKRVMSWVGRL